MLNRDPRPSAGPTSARSAASPRPGRGQALLETAIGVVLLLLLSFSVLDAAMFFFAYLTLQNGVTAATRYAVTGQEPNDKDHPSQHEDAIMRVIRDATPGLNIAHDDVHFHNLTTGGLDAGGPDDVIQVTITHPWQLISPLLWPLVGNQGRITLSVSATMKNEPSPNA
jgi:hypothetical protein